MVRVSEDPTNNCELGRKKKHNAKKEEKEEFLFATKKKQKSCAPTASRSPAFHIRRTVICGETDMFSQNDKGQLRISSYVIDKCEC